MGIIDHNPAVFPSISRPYYRYISKLLVSNTFGKVDQNLVMNAIKIPLLESPQLGQNRKEMIPFRG